MELHLFRAEIYRRDADERSEECAQNPHLGEISDAPHPLDQCPLTGGYQLEEHSDGQKAYGASVLIGAKSQVDTCLETP